jgi:stearoyl-CoA desaturase (delta-9 desaturase)
MRKPRRCRYSFQRRKEKAITNIAQIADSITPVSAVERIGALVAVTALFVGLLVAVYGFWEWALSWIDLAILLVMYIATCLGITIDFRRRFRHQSFETGHRVFANRSGAH